MKGYPFFRNGIPRSYTCPAPFPFPSTLDSIDPRILDPPILPIRADVRWSDDQKLFDEFRSTSVTMAKSFCFVLSNRLSFDNLP